MGAMNGGIDEKGGGQQNTMNTKYHGLYRLKVDANGVGDRRLSTWLTGLLVGPSAWVPRQV
jgi:hypothetical protein